MLVSAARNQSLSQEIARMLKQFVRPAKAVAACLTLMSAVACSGAGAIE